MKVRKWVERKHFTKICVKNFSFELGYNSVTGYGISGSIHAWLKKSNDGSLWVDGVWYHFYTDPMDHRQKEKRYFEVLTKTLKEANECIDKAVQEFSEFALVNGTVPYAEPAMFEVNDWIHYSNEEFKKNYPWRNKAHKF